MAVPVTPPRVPRDPSDAWAHVVPDDDLRGLATLSLIAVFGEHSDQFELEDTELLSLCLLLLTELARRGLAVPPLPHAWRDAMRQYATARADGAAVRVLARAPFHWPSHRKH